VVARHSRSQFENTAALYRGERRESFLWSARGRRLISQMADDVLAASDRGRTVATQEAAQGLATTRGGLQQPGGDELGSRSHRPARRGGDTSNSKRVSYGISSSSSLSSSPLSRWSSPSTGADGGQPRGCGNAVGKVAFGVGVLEPRIDGIRPVSGISRPRGTPVLDTRYSNATGIPHSGRQTSTRDGLLARGHTTPKHRVGVSL